MGTTHDAPLLEVRDLRTQFLTTRGWLQAVAGVSFDVAAGETLAIVGESGSGKSVLARSIMNLLPQTAQVDGATWFEAKAIGELTRQERRHFWGTKMAMIFQDPMSCLNPVRRVEPQLTDPLRYHLGLTRTQARQRALELLDTVRIPSAARRLDQYPHELSGGMRQRVMIAIALSCNPRLLIADEPTTALDVTVQKQILDLLSSLQRDLGMAMILITHDLGVAAGRADRIAVMYAGTIVEVADTRLLFRSMRHPYTSALLASIPRLADKSHTRLKAISGRPPDMVRLPAGCRFAPRCSRAEAACIEAEPRLVPNGDAGHEFACFNPLEGPAAGAGPRASADRNDMHGRAGEPSGVG